MDQPYLKGNKKENRPHYYCFQDMSDGFYWMIPMSSQVEKYEAIVEKKLKKGKRCDIIHIEKLDNGKKDVFLIQDMFPITEQYIAREYTINGKPLKLTSEASAKIIDRKARTVRAMLKQGIQFFETQHDVNAIIAKLREGTGENETV